MTNLSNLKRVEKDDQIITRLIDGGIHQQITQNIESALILFNELEICAQIIRAIKTKNRQDCMELFSKKHYSTHLLKNCDPKLSKEEIAKLHVENILNNNKSSIYIEFYTDWMYMKIIDFLGSDKAITQNIKEILDLINPKKGFVIIADESIVPMGLKFVYNLELAENHN